jgi:hypothetical protein
MWEWMAAGCDAGITASVGTAVEGPVNALASPMPELATGMGIPGGLREIIFHGFSTCDVDGSPEAKNVEVTTMTC